MAGFADEAYIDIGEKAAAEWAGEFEEVCDAEFHTAGTGLGEAFELVGECEGGEREVDPLVFEV